MTPSARSGFTLVEAVIGMAIMALVLGVAVVAQGATNRLNSSTSSRGLLDIRALNTIERVSDELRWASAAALVVASENASDRIDLQFPTGFVDDAPTWSTVVTYRVEPSERDSNENEVRDDWRLVRLQDGATRVLTHHVTPGGFSATLDDQVLTLRLALARREGTDGDLQTTHVQTAIHLRN